MWNIRNYRIKGFGIGAVARATPVLFHTFFTLRWNNSIINYCNIMQIHVKKGKWKMKNEKWKKKNVCMKRKTKENERNGVEIWIKLWNLIESSLLIEWRESGKSKHSRKSKVAHTIHLSQCISSISTPKKVRSARSFFLSSAIIFSTSSWIIAFKVSSFILELLIILTRKSDLSLYVFLLIGRRSLKIQLL